MKNGFYKSILSFFVILFCHCAYGQIIITYAGTISAGYSGDGGIATNAQLFGPNGLAVDDSGNLFIADRNNNVIRKVTPGGIITTFAGNNTAGYSGDGGPATNAQLNTPFDIAIDHSGNIFFTDYGNDVIREINDSGVITTLPVFVQEYCHGGVGVCGPPGGPNHAFTEPKGIAMDGNNNIYVSCNGNMVLKIPRNDTALTFAGDCCSSYTGDGGIATAASLNTPIGLACDNFGNVYIGDEGNNVVRKVNGLGIITTCVGDAAAPGFSGDGGPATGAKLDGPFGVTTDNAGNLYVQDIFNRRIRKVDLSTNIITTVAGDGTAGYSGDGGPATDAEFYDCAGLAVDQSGDLYIADLWFSVVREVIALTLPITLGASRANTARPTLSLYPNPTKGRFIVSASIDATTNENTSLEIINLLGQSVYKEELAQQTGSVQARINLSDNLPDGLYLLYIRSGTETVVSKFALNR